MTVAEESTDNRLLNLESHFGDDVRIRPGDVGEVVVEAYGLSKIVLVTYLVSNKILSDDDLIKQIDIAVTQLKSESKQRETWDQWLKRQGLNG